MVSYHFPIILGQNQQERIVMIHLTDGREDYQENRVVVVSNSPNEPLFRIPKEAQMVDAQGANFLPIHNLTITDTSGTITMVDKDDFYEYMVNDNDDYGYDGTIEFSYICGNITYEGTLNIIRTDDGNVLKINIDLGSEATQATCFCRQLVAGACQPINIIDAIKRNYTKRDYDKLESPSVGPLFTQQDEGNNYYYKTGNITFHKFANNSYGDLSLNEQPETDKVESYGAESVKPFINYLNVSAVGKNANSGLKSVWALESPYTEKLPNIKVLFSKSATIGQLCNVRAQWKSPKRSIIRYSLRDQDNITSVLRVIYEQIIAAAEKGLEQFYNYHPERIKATSVLILVPNIYAQEHIDKLLYELNHLNNGEMKYDFRVISESDAAFLGVKVVAEDGNDTILKKINSEIDDDRQKDAYLIIDSGKGTTDFSIINYNPSDPNSSIASYKRGGIAGAGAAIDYVFTRIVARQIYENSIVGQTEEEKNDFVDGFMTVISMLSPALQDSVMRLVEEAKKNYNVEKGEIPAVYKAFPIQIVEGILDDGKTINDKKAIAEWGDVETYVWDKTFTTLAEIDKKEIESVCNKIAEGTMQEIFKTDEHITNRIDFVLMTGRSFHFEPLRSAFEKMMKEKRGIHNVNFSGFWASICNFIWYRPAYKIMRKGKQTHIEEEELKKRANLKIDDTTLRHNMKEVSVMFSERDLGYNCNSDLCCLDSLKLLNSDNEFDFKQENFWKGFTSIYDTPTYYIGYNGTSFAGLRIIQRDRREVDDLVIMTLFPNTYIRVNL